MDRITIVSDGVMTPNDADIDLRSVVYDWPVYVRSLCIIIAKVKTQLRHLQDKRITMVLLILYGTVNILPLGIL